MTELTVMLENDNKTNTAVGAAKKEKVINVIERIRELQELETRLPARNPDFGDEVNKRMAGLKI